MRITPQEAVLLAVDYQEKLIPAMCDKEELIKNSLILLAGVKALNIPMVVTRQYPKGIGDTLEAVRQLTSQAKVYDKDTFSAFQDAAVKQGLEALQRKKIILCGTEAHVCVLQTAVDMQAAGYQVYYVTDCVGSRKANDKKFGIKRAAQEGAILTTYEGVLFELMGSSTIPAFKAVSALVK